MTATPHAARSVVTCRATRPAGAPPARPWAGAHLEGTPVGNTDAAANESPSHHQKVVDNNGEVCYSVGAPTGEASTEPNQRGPARKGRPSFFFCPSQPKAPSRRKLPGHPDLPRAAEIAPCRFPVRFAVGSCRRENVPTPKPPPFYRRAPLRVGAPTPTTPRRSPPALKRRGLRAASQHRPLYSFFGGLRYLSSLGLSAGLGGGSAIPQSRPKCKGKMHGPAFIPFGRGRPCILSVPAASGGPPRGDGPPSLACRACGPSGWFGAPPF